MFKTFDRNNSCSFWQIIQRPHSNSGPPCLEDVVGNEDGMIDTPEKSTGDQFVSYIISSTPELAQFQGDVDTRYSNLNHVVNTN